MRKGHFIKGLWHFLPLIFLLSFTFPGCSSPAANITEENNLMKINMGKHHLVAEKKSDVAGSFLIMGGFTPNSEAMEFFTAGFLAIPKDQAQELINKYGDISHCKTAGAAEAQSRIRPITFLTEKPDVRNKILETVRLAKGNTWPSIEISGTELNIVEHKYGEMLFNMTGMGTFYLVNEITIKEGIL